MWFMLRKPPLAKFMYKKAMYMFLTGFIIYNMNGRRSTLPSEGFCKPKNNHVEKNKIVMTLTCSLLQIKKRLCFRLLLFCFSASNCCFICISNQCLLKDENIQYAVYILCKDANLSFFDVRFRQISFAACTSYLTVFWVGDHLTTYSRVLSLTH